MFVSGHLTSLHFAGPVAKMGGPSLVLSWGWGWTIGLACCLLGLGLHSCMGAKWVDPESPEGANRGRRPGMGHIVTAWCQKWPSIPSATFCWDVVTETNCNTVF